MGRAKGSSTPTQVTHQAILASQTIRGTFRLKRLKGQTNNKENWLQAIRSINRGPMRQARWLKPNPEGDPNPELAIYHVVSRVVDRRFVFGTEEKEHFRILVRMYERFSGCRVLSYCFMTNHFHLLLEVPPGGVKKGESMGLSDEDLLRRLGGLYSKAYVNGVERILIAHFNCQTICKDSPPLANSPLPKTVNNSIHLRPNSDQSNSNISALSAEIKSERFSKMPTASVFQPNTKPKASGWLPPKPLPLESLRFAPIGEWSRTSWTPST